MADEARVIRSINWRDVFPFTNLFRAFRIAVHPSKLLLALAALLMLYFGGRVMDGIWPNKHSSPAGEFGYSAARRGQPEAAGGNRGIFISFFEHQVRQVNNVAAGVLSNTWVEPAPVDPRITAALGLPPAQAPPSVFGSARRFLVVGPGTLFGRHPLYAILFSAYFLLIWSIFGGAISRIAAVHVARDEKISVRQALQFSVSKVLSFLFAPLIPLLIVLVIGSVVAAVGWVLLHIPVVGPILTGAFFFLALIAGFVMALVLLGTIGGFNLMYPTVAVEGSDSFDAISRSFSYVFARPWRMLFYTLVAIAYGALTYTFARFFIYLILALTHFFVGWWLTGEPGAYWKGNNPTINSEAVQIWQTPELSHLPHDVDYDRLATSEDIAAGFISLWVYLVIGLLGAYAISFYFSANTIIYYLMRREVDATEMDDVYLEDADDDFGDPAPVAGTTPEDAAASGAPALAGGPSGQAGGSSRETGGSSGETGGMSAAADGTPGSNAGGGAKAYGSPQAQRPAAEPMVAGPQVDNPPGDTLTYAAPSDAPPVDSAAQDPKADKPPERGTISPPA